MKNSDYRNALTSLLQKNFVSAGYEITQTPVLDPAPENAKYEALTFTLHNKNIVYRKANVTPDRPGAFLSVWQRPSPTTASNKPIPLISSDLDYLFVHVEEDANIERSAELIQKHKQGIFIFPTTLLIKKGIVSSDKGKGKTGFRVFPPWSSDRGVKGSKVFSTSGKKTQAWQLPYFLAIDEQGLIEPAALHGIFAHK